MSPFALLPRKDGARAVLAAIFLLTLSWPSGAAADGALAVGVPADVAKSGFDYGFTNNRSSADDAKTTALELCRKPGPTKSKVAMPLCAVVGSYRDQCVAVAMDPQAGTPGVGWAIAADKRSAEAQALAKCEATAGPGRRAACKVDSSGCDGSAQ